MAKESEVAERAIRGWFGEHLINKSGLRGQAVWEQAPSDGLAEPAMRSLVDRYLVRMEQRSGATWFELGHDRLAEPVRRNNRAWRRAQRSGFQRQAQFWQSEARPAHPLLTSKATEDARRWVHDHPDEVTVIDREFLAQSELAWEKASQEQRRRLRVTVVGAVLLLALIIFASWAYWAR